MSELKEKMTQFIIEQGADNKILKTILDSIEEWKKKPAYKYIPPKNKIQKITLDPSKDKAGEIRKVEGKTIGDVAREEEDILNSYSGDGWTSWNMHRGYVFPKVGNAVLKEVRFILYELKTEFISQNSQEFIDYFQEDIENFSHDYYGFDEDKPTVEFSVLLDEDAIDTMMIFMDSNDEFSDYDEEFMEMYVPDYCFLFDYNYL